MLACATGVYRLSLGSTSALIKSSSSTTMCSPSILQGIDCSRWPWQGACNTEPAVDQKECAMRGALNECCVAIQKLIVYPLEFDTEVRATIPINIDLMRAVHGKKADVIQTKATARGIGELVQGAQFSFQCLSLRCGARRVGWVIGGWVSTLSAT
jgi:hypothetical protein